MVFGFFVRGLNQLRVVKRNERGFTLIELLVVVIIIGILAAIAIPTFLNQREGAQDSAAKSDLRNAATAQEAYYVNENTYASGVSQLPGFNKTADVTISIPSSDENSFCIQASHDSSDNNFHFASSEGRVSSGNCT